MELRASVKFVGCLPAFGLIGLFFENTVIGEVCLSLLQGCAIPRIQEKFNNEEYGTSCRGEFLRYTIVAIMKLWETDGSDEKLALSSPHVRRISHGWISLCGGYLKRNGISETYV
ncbi:hypothetical protein AVEN_225195-1 [Araneus ventricosus]|uniref:Uncharacterized protein n=1 Tax=Araneus ventricosus TaxID=182803 RepID=A0A4Y2ALH8_ARAVE|nr:hypothetical protein AVEN_225195-1 [Araneus ventricosus]